MRGGSLLPCFIKKYGNAGAAASAIDRASILRSQDISTPDARPGKIETEVAFEHIDGISGQRLLDASLRDLLRPLARLHTTKVEGLPKFDPWLRIRPRLSSDLRERFRSILCQTVPVGGNTLHGDFHVGQLIRDRHGRVWIVDLDDLAVGPPEADLGNFIAHVATTGSESGFDERLVKIQSGVMSVWQGAGSLNLEALESFWKIAILRRHLKLREAGRPDFENEIFNVLRDETTRTFPSGNGECHG